MGDVPDSAPENDQTSGLHSAPNMSSAPHPTKTAEESERKLPSLLSIFKSTITQFIDEFKLALLSRKYWIFIGTTSAASYHLWQKKLEEGEYVQLIIWLFLLFFAGNIIQKVVDKEKQPRKMATKLKSSKFLATAAMLTFLNFALQSQVLSAPSYTTLTIWLVGMFFGVDVASIVAFRSQIGNGEVLGKIFDTQSKPRKRPPPDQGSV